MSRDNKSLRLHLNARDFSQHKTKMSAGCVGVVQRVYGFPQTGHREKKWLQIKMDIQSLTGRKIISIKPVSFQLPSLRTADHRM